MYLRFVDIFAKSSQLDEVVKEAKKKGIPFEAKELARNPKISANENAHLALTKLGKDIGQSSKIRTEMESYVPAQGAKIPPTMIRFLERCREIARFKSFDPGHDLDFSKIELRPEDELYRIMGLALYKSATQKAMDRDIDGSIDDLKSLGNLASQLKSERSLTGGTTAIVLNNYYSSTEINICHFCTGTEINLSKLRYATPDEVPLPSFIGCMNGNFYRFLAFVRNESYFAKLNDGDKVDSSRVVRTGLPTSIGARSRVATFLTLLIKMEDMVKSEPNLAAATKKMDKYLEDEPTSLSITVPIKWLAPLAKSAKSWERCQLRHRIFLTSMDLLKENPTHNFPTTLDTAPDTLAGGNLVYHGNDHGFALYSRGENGKDDGGPKTTSTNLSSDDVGFVIMFNSR